jgi:formylglycine-generating enzyme required for sulfatase activity
VTIPKGFYLSATEITQAQWQAIIQDNPSCFKGANRPVEQVSWYTVQNFITSLNYDDKGAFRLPSEAEWEYACRAGTNTRFSFGNNDSFIGDYACNQQAYTHSVARKKPNPWGLYDMHGNVMEWCADDYHENYKGAPVDGSAWIDNPRIEFKVARGGSWRYFPGDCRSANRFKGGGYNSYTHGGFRLVMSLF